MGVQISSHLLRVDRQARSTAIDSRSILVGVLRFKSGSTNSLNSFETIIFYGNYWEYIKTKEAQAEADSRFRKTLNFWLSDGKHKLIKFRKGSKGTLDYGKYVIMLETERDSEIKRLIPKSKPMVTILWGDFGILARSIFTKDDNQKWKFYKLRSAAEKEYAHRVRMMD